MFKVNFNFIVNFEHISYLCCSVSIVNFEQVNAGWECTEAATGGVLWKKLFLEISQYSQEKTCAKASLLIKLQAWGLQRY